jgi:hypothetical protein
MKTILFLMHFFLAFSLSAQTPLTDNAFSISQKGILSKNPNLSITEPNNITETDNCKFYLKYPPVVSTFFNTADSWERIELNVKDENSQYDIELTVKFHLFYNQEAINYKMYDDGTHGDYIANDNIFTNSNIYFPHKGNEIVTSIAPCPTTFNIKYLSNNTLIHTDEVSMDFYNVNPDFLTNLNEPEFKYLNHEKSVIWADNFIFVNKNKNWGELIAQTRGNCSGGYEYIWIIRRKPCH